MSVPPDARRIGDMLKHRPTTTGTTRLLVRPSTDARTSRNAVGTAIAAVTLLASAAPAAHADSLVFIKDHNVWLAQPDGSKLTQVTTDGNADQPYRSPSQADDGTIAAGYRNTIVRLEQNGDVLNTIDPPALVNSVSQPVDGAPVGVAISPDGTKIAYSFASYTCPIAADCLARSVSGITYADRQTAANAFSTTYFGHPRWVGNARVVVGGGYGSHANLVDIAAGSQPSHWFDDGDYVNSSSDLGMTTVSRDGTRIAAIHGYDSGDGTSNKRLLWFAAKGDPRTAALPAQKPEIVCISSIEPGLADPVWSPNGDQLAWSEGDGIHRATSISRTEADCGNFAESLVLPGASEPDWGPAAVDPRPRRTPAPTPTATPKPGASGTPGGTNGDQHAAGAIALAGKKKPTLRAAIRSGMKLELSGFPGKQRVTVQVRIDAATAKRAGFGKRARQIASATVRTSAAGSASVTIHLPAATGRRLQRAKHAPLTFRAKGAADLLVDFR